MTLLHDIVQITDREAASLAAAAAHADGWPLEDPTTLQAIRRALASDPEAAALAGRLRAQLEREGAAVVGGVDTGSDEAVLAVFELCAIVSPVGNDGEVVYTVAPDPGAAATDLSKTDSEFPFHTDSTFLRRPHDVVALACVARDPDSGGVSRLLRADTLRAALEEGCAPRTLRALGEPAFPFRLQDPLYGTGVQLTPVLTVDGRVRYRRDVLHRLLDAAGPACPDEHREALAELETVLDAVEPDLELLLAPGEMLVFDNARVLHARTPITPGAHRELRRLKGFRAATPDFRLLT